MIVVDSSALVAVLLKEPNYLAFVEALATNAELLIGVPNALEVVMVGVGKLGESGRAKAEALIAESGVRIVAMEREQFDLAVEAFMQFGRGRNHPARLNYGDCMAYALAKSLDAPLLFKGDDFGKTDIRSAL